MSFPAPPDVLFGQLFIDVQLARIFPDQKTFVDCVPKLPPADVLALYESQKTQPGFDLARFVETEFVLPGQVASDFVSDTSVGTAEHIRRLWDRLTRPADQPVPYSSRLPLPHPYVVPGGRFREIFYWDSYFTMLGLVESGRLDLMRGMLDNFAYLIDTFGFIPNGNRTYFLSRSQPPFFALMVRLLAENDGPAALATYRPALEKEYRFWMEKRAVTLPDGRILNRFWDGLAPADRPRPRPEAYAKELALLEREKNVAPAPEVLWNQLRAACESGWDFSSRWYGKPGQLASTRTADLLSVDLNCLLFSLEDTLAEAHVQAGNVAESATFRQAADARKQAIQTLFWNDETGFFHDVNVADAQPTPALTLAGVFPLFLNLATPEQAARVHETLRSDFLQAGGWVTTLVDSGQQWDWPNGWAPLQWIVYKGLLNYGFTETANEGRDRWLALNDKVFKATGKLMEKYNVADAALTTGGGEYPNQDGFGWTNGVYLAMLADVQRST